MNEWIYIIEFELLNIIWENEEWRWWNARLEWWKWLFYKIDKYDCYLNLILIDNDWYLNYK